MPKMSRAEAGRRGGLALVEKRGREHMRQIGTKGARKGGLALVEKRGREYMRTIGAKGFQTYIAKYCDGIAEQGIYKLAKAGRLTINWPQGSSRVNGITRICLDCGRSLSQGCAPDCPNPIPF